MDIGKKLSYVAPISEFDAHYPASLSDQIVRVRSRHHEFGSAFLKLALSVMSQTSFYPVDIPRFKR